MNLHIVSLPARMGKHYAIADLSPMAGKAVCISGATGLLGYNLTRRMAEAAADVQLCTSRLPFLSGEQFDFVIHAAGYGQPAKFMADPLGTLKVATAGTLAMLSAVKEGGKFLFLSSSEVYSGLFANAESPHSEEQIGTTDPSHPRSCYIEGKRAGEAIVHAARSKGIDAKAARVCLAYGPGVKLDDDRIMSIMIRSALTTKRIVLHDSGEATRCYCYVDDAVNMLLNILLYGKEPIYNVGNHAEATTIQALARKIADKTGADLFRRMGEEFNIGAPGYVAVEISRYCTEFNRPDFVSLDVGLDRTIDHFRALLSQ